MYSFSALIYDGLRQQLVAGEFSSKDAFNRHLNDTFGVHVCLWQCQNPSTQVASQIERITNVKSPNEINPNNHV
ncbi:hypothetical protein GTH32_07080 [Alteromonas sp. 345S023]|uniref:Uncharacterized protein n=1 Tax=Alteromonas profundi TaxID=2696062 RepID=A0A7X5LKE3_9ALTE|nr:hypothetical protein [Alteromonas profundi]NDV90956.1 hypothetical protein [Alteromonas profundi]